MIIVFPKSLRPRPEPLPADAEPGNRKRNLELTPCKGRWRLEEWDDGGGFVEFFSTKREALARAMCWVDTDDAELKVFNRPLPKVAL